MDFIRFIVIAWFVSLLLISCAHNKQESNNEHKDSIPPSTSEKQEINLGKINLAFVGSYVGLIPCADCSGIDDHFTLKKDGSYTDLYSYRDDNGVSDTMFGKWGTVGDSILLMEYEMRVDTYFIRGSKLIMHYHNADTYPDSFFIFRRMK